MNVLKGTKLEGTRVDQTNTPKFWRRVRNWSLLIGTIATTVATGGLALPVLALNIAGGVALVSGGVATFAATRKEE